MRTMLNRLLSPAMIVACLAVGLALGGVSYAAGVLPVDSVGEKQLKERAVTLPKISPAARSALKGQARAFAFVDTAVCHGPGSACTITKAQNVLSARRVRTGGYCVTVGAGINANAIGATAGVNFRTTAPPTGNATAMIDTDNSDCLVSPSDFKVVTERIPQSAPVTNGNAEITAEPTNGVGFWLLVP
jgi:hypothetical protein